VNLKSNPNAKSIQVSLKGTGFYIIDKSDIEITNHCGKKTLLCLNLIFLEKDRMQCKLQKNGICCKCTPNLVKGKQI
jgi:hypothetical protein